MIINGKAYWAKVLRPVPNYSKTANEYSIDLAIDEAAEKALREAGLGAKIKPAVNPTNQKEHASKMKHIRIEVPEKNPKTGELFKAPRVKDKYGQDWDKEVLIGNGSTVDVMFDIREGKLANGQPWVKPSLRGVRVVELVEVEPREEFDYEEPSAEEAWED